MKAKVFSGSDIVLRLDEVMIETGAVMSSASREEFFRTVIALLVGNIGAGGRGGRAALEHVLKVVKKMDWRSGTLWHRKTFWYEPIDEK